MEHLCPALRNRECNYMFKEEYLAAAEAAAGKVQFLKTQPMRYFVLSVLAGMFIGFGVLLAYSVGGQLAGSPATKLIMGCVFGVALSLVIIAGAELFTGNTFSMTAGLMHRKIRWEDALWLWAVCWAGNLVGGVLLAWLYHLTGLGTGQVAAFMASGALTKMTAGGVPLFTRGILCNFLVCLAVWCSIRVKDSAGKLIMTWWCLLAFITTGFEHSVANMTLLSAALMEPAGVELTMTGFWFNLLIVTLGNIVGGVVFVGLAYGYAAGAFEKESTELS